jgi:hypothetical protein
MQNTPNPDVNSPNVGDDSDTNIERENEEMPPPPDRAPNVPIEEPPETENSSIEDDNEDQSPRIM